MCKPILVFSLAKAVQYSTDRGFVFVFCEQVHCVQARGIWLHISQLLKKAVERDYMQSDRADINFLGTDIYLLSL